jgi:transcriptional regulator GlxA family with amidase domain
MAPMRENAAMPARSPGRRPTVAMPIAHGLSVLEFGIASDVFGFDYSDLGVPWYRLAVCSAVPPPARTPFGYGIDAPFGLAPLRRADTIVVPPTHAPYPPELLDALRAAHRRGARLVSLCTGAFTLAAAGLLAGRPATTHWRSAERLAREHPDVQVRPDVLYVDDGDILTSAGAAASMDLCLHVVRCDHGSEIANALARRVVVPPHRDGGQAQFVDQPMPRPAETDDLFHETLTWMESHLAEPLTVEVLARHAAMSPRTFARRFRAATGSTPHRWLRHQRVALAQRLLETTDLPVDVVAQRSGFGTAANLRQHFQRAVRTSPVAYRRTFAVVNR